MEDERALLDGRKISWWMRTRLLAITTLVGAVAVCLLTMLLAPALDATSMLGIPLGLLAATLLAPTFVILLIFLSAKRQRHIDQAQSYFEE